MPKLDLVEITSGDTLLVFDNRRGHLLKMTPGGTTIAEYRLPAELIASIRRGAEQKAQRLGLHTRSWYSPLVKAMSADGRRIFLLFTLGDTVGAVLDPDSGRLRYVMDSSHASAGAARTVALSGDTVVIGEEDGVRQYRMIPDA